MGVASRQVLDVLPEPATSSQKPVPPTLVTASAEAVTAVTRALTGLSPEQVVQYRTLAISGSLTSPVGENRSVQSGAAAV